MGLFNKSPKCQRFFTYESRKLNLKGLTANIPKGEIGDVNVGLGELSIEPQYVEATEKLQELDMLQFSICQNLQRLDKNNTKKDELLEKLINTQIEMLQIAQNPDTVKKK